MRRCQACALPGPEHEGEEVCIAALIERVPTADALRQLRVVASHNEIARFIEKHGDELRSIIDDHHRFGGGAMSLKDYGRDLAMAVVFGTVVHRREVLDERGVERLKALEWGETD